MNYMLITTHSRIIRMVAHDAIAEEWPPETHKIAPKRKVMNGPGDHNNSPSNN